MSAVILDTETTDASDECRVIEFALTEPMYRPQPAAGVAIDCKRYSADRPIMLGALAAHHILEEEIADLPRFPGWDPVAGGVDYIVGHNVDFDWKALGKPNVKRICTLALSRSLWPEIDSHTLSAMIYHVSTDKRIARDLVRGAHSASADVGMLLEVLLPAILTKLLPRGSTWSELWEISELARVPKLMPYGKHKGVLMAHVPGDYKRWLLKQPDVDPYLVQALQGR